MKARIRFSKTGVMKFIGHLDMVRYFQKAFRRSGIDIMYTQGFNPHQILSFAAPLSVGVTSEGEYLDLEVGACESSEAMVARINAEMAEGVSVLSFRVLPEGSKNAMSIVAAADYTLKFRLGMAPQLKGTLEATLAAFYAQPEILIIKKTKKSEKEVDIKPMIYSLHAEQDTIVMQLASGSSANLKPDLVMAAFYDFAGLTPEPFALLLHRRELYADLGTEGERKLVSLEDLGQVIE